MLGLINTIVILASLFYILGKAADKIVFNTRIIAEKLGIPVVFLGIILGFLTSLPETAIGINAIINNIPGIAVGNLLGGVVVILCLVLGVNLVLNRRISTNGEFINILPIFIFLFIPLFLGFDGALGYFDGVVIILAYLGLLYYLYKKDVNFALGKITATRGGRMAKELFYVVISSIIIVIASNMIVREASFLLNQMKITPFFMGLIIFSMGTNLPESAVMFRSWKRGSSDLSISHLMGSAMANVLIIGIFSLFGSLNININISFYLLFIYFVLISVLLLYFYRSDKELTKNEGFVLLAVYFIFLITQIYYAA